MKYHAIRTSTLLSYEYSYNTPSRTVLVFGTSIRDPLCFSFLSLLSARSERSTDH